MGWFSRKPPISPLVPSVVIIHAALERAGESLLHLDLDTQASGGEESEKVSWADVLRSYEPSDDESGSDTEDDRDSRVLLHLSALAVAAAAYAVAHSSDRNARDILSTLWIVLQACSLGARPHDFSRPDRVELARELRIHVIPAIEQAKGRNPRFAKSLESPVFAAHSIDALLSASHRHLDWMAKTTTDVPASVGRYFARCAAVPRSLGSDVAVAGMVAAIVGQTREALRSIQ